MKIRYVSSVCAGVLLALSGRYYFVAVEKAKLRTEAFEFQQVVESLQPQLLTMRQQLQAQQDKLNKASAISQSVGPAVVSDIRLSAEKTNNPRLKELLQKYGVREVASPGAQTPSSSEQHPMRKGAN